MNGIVYVPEEEKCTLALVEKPEEGGTPRGPVRS